MSDWVTPGEAARLLNCHPETIRRACDRGELRHWRTPTRRRERRVSREAVLQWSGASCPDDEEGGEA